MAETYKETRDKTRMTKSPSLSVFLLSSLSSFLQTFECLLHAKFKLGAENKT